METNFFAALLEPPFKPNEEWAHSLRQSLLHPQFSISLREAVGSRLRRNYVWIYLVLELAWLAKLLLYGTSNNLFVSIFLRARIGLIPGPLVIAAVLVLDLVLMVIALRGKQPQGREEVV
jgi:uncharacterized membrane protein